MSIEIERRFLIKNNDWEKLINRKSDIIQGYLSTYSESWIVRIRSEDNIFKLTLKKHITNSKNYEFEYEIPKKEGEMIISEIILSPSFLGISYSNSRFLDFVICFFKVNLNKLSSDLILTIQYSESEDK